jgi:SAM-dependent methyltransferase
MLSFHFLYQLKNIVLRAPFSYGYYHQLRDYRDAAYDHTRDKHPVRNKHNGQEGWKSEHSGDFLYRDYSSYEEYVSHQAQKINEILKMQGGFDNKTILDYRKRFYGRFRYLPSFLSKSAVILCLGARQGTEVEVLWDMGYKNAMGLDLNPGPKNPFVKQGDFMALEYSDSSVDMVYSNCVDHAFDLSKFFQEHARVLKPGGYALYDIGISGQVFGAFESVGWESEESVFLLTLKHFKNVLKVEVAGDWKWMLLQK